MAIIQHFSHSPSLNPIDPIVNVICLKPSIVLSNVVNVLAVSSQPSDTLQFFLVPIRVVIMINKLMLEFFPQFIKFMMILCELILPFIVFMHCSIVFAEPIRIYQELVVDGNLWLRPIILLVIFFVIQIYHVFIFLLKWNYTHIMVILLFGRRFFFGFLVFFFLFGLLPLHVLQLFSDLGFIWVLLRMLFLPLTIIRLISVSKQGHRGQS